MGCVRPQFDSGHPDQSKHSVSHELQQTSVVGKTNFKGLDKPYEKTYDWLMNLTSTSKIYTASEAREKLYTLIKATGSGFKTFEITLRGSEPVMLINKSELEAWQETLDILSNKREINAVRKARKQKKILTHRQMKKAICLK